jgi:ABC-type sugar transport system ATPase subunit
MSRGISVLYQELNVVNGLTVEENLTLGKENHRAGFIRKSKDMGRVVEILKGLDASIGLHMSVGDLSVAQKQVLEIAKVVSTESPVLIMDEPTAALSEDEVRRLFAVIRKLKADGMTIIYISHKLAEVFEIGDYVSVFRDGQMVGTRAVGEISRACRDIPEACLELVKMMLGKVVVESYIPSRTDRSVKLPEVRKVSNRKLHDVHFDLFKGEILGFYGLVGARKTEVARALYGIDEYQGEILINGKPARVRSVRGALSAGFSMVPEERRADGIFAALSIRANIPMMRMASILQGGLISTGKEKRLADQCVPERREPAEGRHFEMSEPGRGHPPHGRAHPRCGRGGQARDPRHHQGPGQRGEGNHRLFLRAPGDPSSVRPDRAHARGHGTGDREERRGRGQ